MASRILVVVLTLCGLLQSSTHASDWPQILGPTRDGIAQGESLADNWPAGGPTKVWQFPAGSGLAGVAVAQNITVLFHRVGNHEVVQALMSDSGKKIWQAEFPTTYAPSFVADDGPRCVPVIHDNRVYVFGSQGGLRCLDLQSGRKIWSRETHADFKAPEGYFGAGSTPIIEGEKILVNVGGAREHAGIVAFSLADGKTVWQATDELASYSSPVAATINGVRQIIFITRLKVVSIDPQTGKVLFELPFGQRGPTVNGANPLVLGNTIFATASYGIGATLAKIEGHRASIVWNTDNLMSSQYTTCIADDGLLYGVHGRQDAASADLRCVDLASQKVMWTAEEFGYATLIKADGKLIILKADGSLVLAAVDGSRFAKLAETKLFDGGSRDPCALPALANGLLYYRNTRALNCVDLRKSQAK